ncbi:MAG: heme exporter protein CcmB [Caldilineaceae bacterium]|nr:heme exporter protein CcmB [Caldilineaceae bacterium]
MSNESLEGLLGRPVQMRTGGGLRAYLRKVWAVAAKDIRAETRAKEVASTMIVFGLLAVIIFGLAFDLRVPKSSMVVPGILWVVILFAGVLGLHRSFGAEVDKDTLAGLLLAPVEPSAIYFGKLLSNLLYLFLMVLIILPVLLVVFDVNLFQPLILLGLFLGTLGYGEVGTLFAALTANSRARESMLPVLLLPVMIPVFMAGVGLTAGILDGRPVSGLVSWLVVLVVFDAIFFVAAYWIVDLIWDGI